MHGKVESLQISSPMSRELSKCNIRRLRSRTFEGCSTYMYDKLRVCVLESPPGDQRVAEPELDILIRSSLEYVRVARSDLNVYARSTAAYCPLTQPNVSRHANNLTDNFRV